VASFKYLFNFLLEPRLRDEAVRRLFEERIGSEAQFAQELYVTWEEARRMQSAGMLIGGHTHRHRPLAGLKPEDLRYDLTLCRALLARNLAPQQGWPFSYPYGKASSFNDGVAAELARRNFTAAFSTETGVNRRGASRYAIRRLDCKHATAGAGAICGGIA
jgi:peptidoglycan/xylan/chitin deacetylase (PgdA/CDA1 family)